MDRINKFATIIYEASFGFAATTVLLIIGVCITLILPGPLISKEAVITFDEYIYFSNIAYISGLITSGLILAFIYRFSDKPFSTNSSRMSRQKYVLLATVFGYGGLNLLYPTVLLISGIAWSIYYVFTNCNDWLESSVDFLNSNYSKF